MTIINEEVILNFYLSTMKKDEIEFLKGRDKFKVNIEMYINELLEHKDMHLRIQSAKNLWKELFEAAMTYIDPDKGGYDDLFIYFDEFVNFEELIFASDSFYRDHTLHCLWVYFLGEYVKRNDQFKKLFNDGSGEMYDMISKILEIFNNEKLKEIIASHQQSIVNSLKFIKNYDSIRCITALTHDLGYPLKKISKINKSIRKILPFMSIQQFDEFNFNYSDVQKGFIDSFLDFLSMNIDYHIFSLSENPNDREIFNKIFKFKQDLNEPLTIQEDVLESLSNEQKKELTEAIKTTIEIENDFTCRMRFSVDFEQYEHGIMSAYILMRTINSLNTFKFRYYNNKDIKINHVDVYKLLPYQEILRSIANHTSTRYKITNICDHSEFLILMDELEEFSRISRANQNRQYVNEFCKNHFQIEDEWFEVDFVYDKNIEDIDPEFAFKNKCKRFLTMFDIGNLSESVKIRLKFIDEISTNKNVYILEIKHKYANIIVNGVEQHIPTYLRSRIFYSKDEYMML